jgi:hypothetical protein
VPVLFPAPHLAVVGNRVRIVAQLLVNHRQQQAVGHSRVVSLQLVEALFRPAIWVLIRGKRRDRSLDCQGKGSKPVSIMAGTALRETQEVGETLDKMALLAVKVETIV